MVAYGLPGDAQPTDVDILIVGTGIGGATLGYALSKTGRSILFLEQGRDLSGAGTIRGLPAEASPEFRTAAPEDRSGILSRAGRNAESVGDGIRNDRFVPIAGCGTGGSSSLYGMVLERPFPRDFETWPIGYEELEPWYAAAESLFEVSGTPDPLRPAAGGGLRPPPALSEANAAVFDHLQRGGLHPYRLHLAGGRHPECLLCQGFLCPSERRCKNDARTVCLLPALVKGDTRLAAETRVTRVDTNGRRTTGVRAAAAGGELEFRAKVVVLAGGALWTPRLLLGSGGLGNGSGLVGRRLMRHMIDLYVLTLGPRLAHAAESKELGLNDFYFASGERLGTVQSFGMAPPLDYLRHRPGGSLWKLLGPAAWPISKAFASAAIVAGIAEDAPDPDNRVELDGEGVRLTYRPTAGDLRRRGMLRRHIRRAFARFGPVRVMGSGREALGHACGTARMGGDPGKSVLDRFNRVHELDNLYVVDASFFPASGGMNPALTIAANALRVAHHLEHVL